MVTVSYVGGDRLRVQVRGHELFTDQPVEDGGDDTAPTPTEIFVAGLAACVGFYAERFLRRHGLDSNGLNVTTTYAWAENPHRVGAIEVAVDAPGLTEDKQVAFSRVIDHCTVHNTLLNPPQVKVRIVRSQPAAA